MKHRAWVVALLFTVCVTAHAGDDTNEIVGLWEMTGFEGRNSGGRICLHLSADNTIAVVAEDTVERFRATASYRLDDGHIVLTANGEVGPPTPFTVDVTTLVLRFSSVATDKTERASFHRRTWAPQWCAMGLRDLGVSGY